MAVKKHTHFQMVLKYKTVSILGKRYPLSDLHLYRTMMQDVFKENLKSFTFETIDGDSIIIPKRVLRKSIIIFEKIT